MKKSLYVKMVTVEAIAEASDQLQLQNNEALKILIAEKTDIDVNKLCVDLHERGYNFFGGIFTGVIHNEQKYEQGAVIAKVPIVGEAMVINGLDNGQFEYPLEFQKNVDKSPTSWTTFVFVDGLAGQIAAFLTDLFNRLGNDTRYIGGGAGSLSLKQMPCVFTGQGVFENAAVVVFSPIQAALGVKHGWQSIKGPLVASKTDKNVVQELNWENAFSVYQETVQADSGLQFTEDNFFDIAKGYPFGMIKDKVEAVVRDPLFKNEQGHMICVGEVPENTVLDILKGVPEALISAAGDAAKVAIETISTIDQKSEQVFVVDCISRVLFLEERFPEELAAVRNEFIKNNQKDIVPYGVLTLGEISSYGNGLLEFFNKTIVVGALYGNKS